MHALRIAVSVPRQMDKMPALSWNETRQNAIRYSREWKGAQDERAEAQTFWNEFFQVFGLRPSGLRRRTVASFEEPVKSLKNTYHRIDLFWKGRLLAEYKTACPALITAGIFIFLEQWNSLMWPLIVTTSPHMRTLMVGLQTFNDKMRGNFYLLMAAATIAVAPIVILFFFLQRFFVEGIARTGIR